MISKYALRANRHAQFLLSEYIEHPRPLAAPSQCQWSHFNCSNEGGALPACLSQERLVFVSFATELMMFPCMATRKMAAFYLQIFRIKGERNGVRAIAALGLPEQNLGFD